MQILMLKRICKVCQIISLFSHHTASIHLSTIDYLFKWEQLMLTIASYIHNFNLAMLYYRSNLISSYDNVSCKLSNVCSLAEQMFSNTII